MIWWTGLSVTGVLKWIQNIEWMWWPLLIQKKISQFLIKKTQINMRLIKRLWKLTVQWVQWTMLLQLTHTSTLNNLTKPLYNKMQPKEVVHQKMNSVSFLILLNNCKLNFSSSSRTTTKVPNPINYNTNSRINKTTFNKCNHHRHFKTLSKISKSRATIT